MLAGLSRRLVPLHGARLASLVAAVGWVWWLVTWRAAAAANPTEPPGSGIFLALWCLPAILPLALLAGTPGPLRAVAAIGLSGLYALAAALQAPLWAMVSLNDIATGTLMEVLVPLLGPLDVAAAGGVVATGSTVRYIVRRPSSRTA